MNSDNITLRQESYGSLNTKGSALTNQELDQNWIDFYKDFESLRVTVGVPAYDPATTYNNDLNDNSTQTFATYSNRFWQWINLTDGNSTPSEGSDWTEVFPSIIAHEKNKDNRLIHSEGNFEVILNNEQFSGQTIPRAIVKAEDSGYNYYMTVQDLTNLGGGFEIELGALTAAGTGFTLEIDSSQASLKQLNAGSTVVACKIEDGKLKLQTPNVIAGTASDGDTLQLDSTGACDFQAGGAGSGVQSVTGDGVGGTSTNPVLTFPTPAEIGAKPDFTENTAFNKNFGTGSGQVQDAGTYDPTGVGADAFNFQNFKGTFQLPSVTTITMNSDQDNLDVDGYNIVFLTASSDNRRITGIKAPASGVDRLIFFVNKDATFTKMFMGSNTSSLANNRMLLRNNATSRNLLPYQITIAIYNHDNNKYHISRMA